MKKIFWGIVMLAFARPYSLRQFKIFCLKIDGMSKDEWDEQEKLIRCSETLRKFFKLKQCK